MECILKSAEEINQEWTKILEKVELGTSYKSIFTTKGKSILPPLMTHERRLQMQKYRQAAMAIEVKRQSKDSIQSKQSANTPTAVAAERGINVCSQVSDASTNTELTPKLEKQPLIILGRRKQQLRFSETLIYDNNCNAIIKFGKASRQSPGMPVLTRLQPLIEESVEAWPQYAVVKEETFKYGIILETTQKQSMSGQEVKENLKLNTETKPEENATLTHSTPININSPIKPKTDSVQTFKSANPTNNLVRQEAKELKRALTSPSLLRVSKDAIITKIVQTYQDVDHKIPLHPQLWKRLHSYPFESKCGTDRAGPSSPNTSPRGNIFQASSNSRIHVKQCLASDLQQTIADNLKTKVSNVNQTKVGLSKTNKRTPRASSNIRYEAHASSHANAQLDCSDSKIRVSSTQRRLSYDPRVTIKRALTPKKSALINNPPLSNSSELPSPAPAEAPVNSTVKQKLLEEMERQQRQRFQLLIMQQTDEQQRMQVEFQEQQQLLMNNLLNDLSTYSSDKDGETDIVNSESSSLTSLPQGRMGFNPSEPDASV